MAKIQMTTPLVEMDGDEMTRIIWKLIKDILILPYIELKSEYYDLSIQNRNETDDKVTFDSANAAIKYGVAVKCATITPNAQRVTEFNLKKMWKSPNGTIRSIMDGTVFRAPILTKGIKPLVPSWTKPIIIARHAYGDIYANTEVKLNEGDKVELLLTRADGSEEKLFVKDFPDTSAVCCGMYNSYKSISGFARACFNYALDFKQDVWFGTKDTISKIYDHYFKDIFAEIYEAEYKEKFKENGLTYEYSLIDDVAARVMKSNGGFLWACKNYDGDVFSDIVATAYGSLGMMSSVLVSPNGKYEFEAAHGTVTRHYHKYLNGEETSTNSIATIFAWTGALAKRGNLDENTELINFAKKLEKAALDTIADGVMTGDLYIISELENKTKVNTEDFLKEVAKRL